MIVFAAIALIFLFGYLFLKYSKILPKIDNTKISNFPNENIEIKQIDFLQKPKKDNIFYVVSGAIILILICLITKIYITNSSEISPTGNGAYIQTPSVSFLAYFQNAFKNTFQQIGSSAPFVKKIFPSPTPTSQNIVLQKVDNVGYQFYLGQIDHSDAPPLNDDIKNAITETIYKSKFPKKLLNNIGIIIVNTLAITPEKRIKTPYGEISIPSFPPVFLSGGGLYTRYHKPMSLIFINSKKICDSSIEMLEEALGRKINSSSSCYVDTNFLSKTLTHELGHHVGSLMTDAEWAQYYKLRNIPTETSKKTSNWNLSPEEDFAEVYTYTFTGHPINTYYGTIIKNYMSYGDKICEDIHEELLNKYFNNDYLKLYKYIGPIGEDSSSPVLEDSELQECRKKVIVSPSIDTNVFDRDPYEATVNQATKNFIIQVVNRLNM